MGRTIPDLRLDNEITLEHCYVLIEHLGYSFDTIEGASRGTFQEIANVDPTRMKEHFDSLFPADSFARLFQTEIGKGVLVGTYAHRLLMLSKKEELDEDN